VKNQIADTGRQTMMAQARLAFSIATMMLAVCTTGARAAENFIVLQSTTSTQNSGLFDAILPEFTKSSGIEVRVVAVGTGQAIKNARNGDGDVLLVHSRAAEEAFVAEGWGVERLDVMYNDFVIAGPRADPAGIAGMSDVTAALAKSPPRRRHSFRAAMIPARTRRSARCGLRPASMRLRNRAAGTARPVRAWALRSIWRRRRTPIF